MRLYFVSARNGWQTVLGGHWLAESPAEAIALAKAMAESHKGLAVELGMGPFPPVDSLQWQAKPSKAAVTNAMNPQH